MLLPVWNRDQDSEDKINKAYFVFGFFIFIFSQDDEKLAYRRLKLLGQGSFGKAFLARDLSNNDLVVMKQVISLKQMDGKHKIIKKNRFKREVIFANPVIQGWWWEVKVVYCILILVTFTYFAVGFCFICTSNNTDFWKQVQVEKMDAKVAWHCFILNLLQVQFRCILLL